MCSLVLLLNCHRGVHGTYTLGLILAYFCFSVASVIRGMSSSYGDAGFPTVSHLRVQLTELNEQGMRIPHKLWGRETSIWDRTVTMTGRTDGWPLGLANKEARIARLGQKTLRESGRADRILAHWDWGGSESRSNTLAKLERALASLRRLTLILRDCFSRGVIRL